MSDSYSVDPSFQTAGASPGDARPKANISRAPVRSGARGLRLSLAARFAFVLGLTVLLFVALSVHSFLMFKESRDFHVRDSRGCQLIGEVLRLDEVLTMSAKMAAVTGDLKRWETRYHHNEVLLDGALRELDALIPEAVGDRRTTTANVELVEMENRAFRLAAQGDLNAAAAVLNSAEYDGQKGIYTAGMSDMRGEVEAMAVRVASDQGNRMMVAEGMIFVAATTTIVLWFVVLRAARKQIATQATVEQELIKQKSVLASVLAHIPYSVFWKDRHCVYLGGNDQVAREAGLKSATELPGKTDFDLAWTPAEAEFFRKCDREVMDGGVPLLNIEESQTRPDGSVCTLMTSKVPLRSESGEVIGILGIYVDITDRKAAEAEREQLHKQLFTASRQAGMAEVAAGILHNVGNVLNSVNVSTTLVHDRVKNSVTTGLTQLGALVTEQGARLPAFIADDARGRTLPAFIVELAEQAANERAGLMDELESLARNVEHIKHIVSVQQSYAGLSSVREPIDVVDLLEDAINLNANAFERHNVRLQRTYDADARPTTMSLDRHKVMQILVNLLTNAKQAMDDVPDDHRVLTVRLYRRDAERLVVEVTDNGCGIDPDHAGRIFEHGFTTKRDGHGFGLHSSALAAREMGGSLSAHSGGPGLGATFALELRATSDADARPPGPKQHAQEAA